MYPEGRKLVKNEYNREENRMVPPVDIYETENEYVIRADMPAVRREDVEITLENNRLELKGTTMKDGDRENMKYCGYELCDYYRSFNVGNDIDAGAIAARMENGVLTLTLPKKEEVKPRKIEISVN